MESRDPIPPGHGESHTDEDTLWNRPDRGDVKRDYEVIGVWADGNPVTLAHRLTYPEAVVVYEQRMATKKTRGAPFYGIFDPDDPERGYGPWDDDA